MDEFIITIHSAADPMTLNHAAELVAEALREILNVQAPLRLTRSGRKVAATPATPGDPPRRVTGNLQGGVEVRWLDASTVKVGVFDIPYARRLEMGMGHPYLGPVVNRNLGILSRQLGSRFALE